MNRAEDALPESLLVSWYGDDFTGSAAVMEVFALAGLPSVLFLDLPTPELLARFSGFRGIGIAGSARSKTPEWMHEHLPPIYDALAALRAPVTHYKVCSTLDSAPRVGSIGKAVQLAQQRLDTSWMPLLLGAPPIGRYQLFGNLFAKVDGVGHRLDRHPTMSRHPVTPMREADVRRHLAQQTDIAIGLIDYLALIEGRADEVLASELASGHRLIALDVIDDRSLIAAGRLIWKHRGNHLLSIGSQGIQYALVAYWRSAGMIDAQPASPRGRRAERIAVMSGSCSPTTAAQIAWAEQHGFEPIRLGVCSAVDEHSWSAALATATRNAVRAISNGRDPIVFSARGPDDPAIAALHAAIDIAGSNIGSINERIGTGLGTIFDSVLRTTPVRRGVFAGGDTSSHGTKALHVHALTFVAPTVPGAALFRAHSTDPLYDGLELALKGGQMGAPDYFGQIKNGGAAAQG